MPDPVAQFDRLARIYRLLEFAAFGRELERARFCLLDRLRDARSILVLGEGDGRCLTQLVRVASAARLHVIDASPAMLARAAARLTPADRSRVTFTCTDARDLPLAPAHYDAAITLFFLDCFPTDEAARLVVQISAALQPRAHWLHADFALPPAGWRRARARAWLTVLYFFFRWQTGLSTRALPPSEDFIRAAGFAPAAQIERQHGLLRSVHFQRDRSRR